MKKLGKITLIIARVGEVFHWIAAALMLALTVLNFVNKDWMRSMISFDDTPTATVYGFQFLVIDSAGNVNLPALALYGLGAAIILGLMALVFRNIRRIVQGSLDGVRFQAENVQALRNIGIFYILTPAVALVFSALLHMVGGPDVETSVDFGGVVTGLVVLCLTQFFAHGMELEKDSDSPV